MFEAGIMEGGDIYVLTQMARQYLFLNGSAQVRNETNKVQFEYEAGGRQGGVETPRLSRGVVRLCLQEVDASWKRRGLGFQAAGPPEAAVHLTSVIWADNICFVREVLSTRWRS